MSITDIGSSTTISPGAMRDARPWTAARMADQERTSAAYQALFALLDTPVNDLSPMMLIALVERQVSSVNADLRVALTEMQNVGRRSAELRSTLEAMGAWERQHEATNVPIANSYHNVDGRMVQKTEGEHRTVKPEHQVFDLDQPATPADQFEEVTLPDGTRRPATWADVLRRAGVERSSLTTVGNYCAYNRQNMESLRNTLRSAVERLQEGAETRNVRMQELVSRRGQFTQMISQILASQHETDKAVLQNTRA